MAKKQQHKKSKPTDDNSEIENLSANEDENYDNVEYKLNVVESDAEEETDAPNLVMVNSDKIVAINQSLDTKSLKAVKTVIKIFSICFNEKELKNSKLNYQIQNANVMNEILDIYFTKLPSLLQALPTKSENDLLKLIYLKNSFNFLTTLENEALIVRTIKGIKSFYPMFTEHRSLNKKLIREIINLWARENNFSVKFNSFILLKVMITSNDNEFKDYIFKNMIDKMAQYAPHWNWNNLDSIIFTRNCVVEAISLGKEVAYIIMYERLKNLSSLYLEVSKDKVS